MQLLHLARWLHARGWNLVVAAPESGPISEILREECVDVVLDPTLLSDLTQKKLRELALQFDVVVANTIASWPAVEAAHQAKIPVLWYIHETKVAVRLINQISEIRAALLHATSIVTPSRSAAQVLDGLTRARIEVLPYGIPELEIVARQPDGKKVSFVALGSFEPRKGEDILIEAIHKLHRTTRAKTSFHLAGRILDQQFFKKIRSRSSGLKNVQFTVALGHDEALSLLSKSDVLIVPSRDETMPIAILEAASLGKAIISCDVGGIKEWIHDELNGLLVPPENPEALAEAITRCARDPALVRQLGTTARHTFERHFTLDRFSERFAALLREISKGEPDDSAPAQLKYERWLAAFDNAGPNNRSNLRRRARQLQRQPLISVLLPVYNPNLQLLEAAINSVRNQVYEQWELCVADDASTDPDVHPYLEQVGRGDPRIKLIFRDENRHISACSNSALGLATGEWCALLDQDDALSEKAIAFVALEIARHPNAGLIYSDEDKIDNEGKRSNPFFKTDWNPELFLGQNYINHLGVYRTSLLREIGGFREGYEGSQDYDLALRCLEKLRPEQVRHVPRILYHWRMIAGSLAAVVDAKPYAKEAARRAIGDHLLRQGIPGQVVACPENIESHRVIYDVDKPEPLVSIVIPTRDLVQLLEQCVRSLRERTDYGQIEIVIVDNDSTEKATHEYFRELESKQIARVVPAPGPFSFSRLINCGAEAARGELLAFLNNDTEASESGWLREMVSHAVRPEVGAVGARLWYPDGTLQHGGTILGLGGVAGHAYHRIPRGHPGYFNRAFLQGNYSAVTAACMVLRKKVFVDLGGFDESNLEIDFNDVDFCLRLRKRGLQIVWTPYANLIHHESVSRGHHLSPEALSQFLREARYMQQKWTADLLCDPFYSLNFSLNWPGFDFAFPPRYENCANVAMPTGQRDFANVSSMSPLVFER
jgi:glycosyltransferase involved in cell wall biosynthesis/GT2 family glycosyltransferase